MQKNSNEHVYIAPARVNLIGEHTDYTGGLVLPMAIPFSTTATISPNSDSQYHFHSEQFKETREMPVDDRSEAAGNWSDYPVGVLRQLQLRGITPPPFHLEIHGNVPFGAGLSSSASVEVASAIAILAHANATLPLEEIAMLCKLAENDYVHSPCGIMDQFVITAAKAGHALLLDTRSLSYEHIPMNHDGLVNMRIVVCNSMVKHSIADGDYGLRRREVEAGQDVLRAAFPQLRDLADATLDQLESCVAKMTPESYRRCRHIITENARVREAKDAMTAGDAAHLGKLMISAHASQRDDFECSCEEIDFLVDQAVALEGCLGARMTGGGFGGCTVNLVSQDKADTFAQALAASYLKRFNIKAETYICEAVDGACFVTAPKQRNRKHD
ncbi:galactokinase [Granulicella mallensis]|uniref:galactokinase n=1 Tax=Granulicella mallensis TaxID=940614 RepID=UPI001CBBD8C4|nr:galactokinase [Granulicella mallensis]